MKRTILISTLTTVLTAAAMFAQSTPQSSAPGLPLIGGTRMPLSFCSAANCGAVKKRATGSDTRSGAVISSF